MHGASGRAVRSSAPVVNRIRRDDVNVFGDIQTCGDRFQRKVSSEIEHMWRTRGVMVVLVLQRELRGSAVREFRVVWAGVELHDLALPHA